MLLLRNDQIHEHLVKIIHSMESFAVSADVVAATPMNECASLIFNRALRQLVFNFFSINMFRQGNC
jgi:hypothetical protein